MKPNISAIAREHNVSRESLRNWRDGGLDLADSKAIAERVKIMRGKSADDIPADGTESLAEAKRRRAIADADLSEMRSKREAGTLVDLAVVEDAFQQIGLTMKARLLEWPSTLVHELEGRSGVEIHKILDNRIVQLLTQIYENHPIKTAAKIHAKESPPTAPPSKTAKPAPAKKRR